jgi:hypothetical protein
MRFLRLGLDTAYEQVSSRTFSPRVRALYERNASFRDILLILSSVFAV